MTDTPIKATRWHLFAVLGARKYERAFEGVPCIALTFDEQPHLPLFWPVDRKLVEEVAS